MVKEVMLCFQSLGKSEVGLCDAEFCRFRRIDRLAERDEESMENEVVSA
jgi:hypothetical protein